MDGVGGLAAECRKRALQRIQRRVKMRGGDEGFAKMFHSLRHETKLIFGIVHLRRGILGEGPECVDLPAEGAARLVT